ncbi:MAG: nicotinate mononucleotide-dependent phosphoribosyltransferase CobT, partial [Acidilobaceae archaeon]
MGWLSVHGPSSPGFLAGDRLAFLVFIASTRTSTIPGISVAGSSPEATLYTPALDVEYLIAGRPITLNVIPVTPEGIPTPALITRAALRLLNIPTLIVDAGSFVEPKIPHIRLSSRLTGGSIGSENALPSGASRSLFEESRLLALTLSKNLNFILGESMPGGTTTALSIMEALGYKARFRVSSASPSNPHTLKIEVVEKAFKRAGITPPERDVFKVIDLVGDPLHVSIAGFISGALEGGSKVLLAGGTQMCSVLAILRRLGVELEGKIAVGTTGWLVSDSQSDMMGLLGDIAPEVPLLAAHMAFPDSPFEG